MVRERGEIEEQYRWDLTTVYRSDAEWEDAFRSLRGKLDQLKEREESFTESGSELLETLRLYEEVMSEAGKLSSYARMKSDQDTRDQDYQAMKSRAEGLMAEVSSITSFIEPGVQSLGDERLERMIESTAGLEKYRHYLEHLLMMEPRTRSLEVEELLADLSDVLSAPQETFNMLSNADLQFPKVVGPDGEEVELTQSNFTSLMKDSERDFREKVHRAFYDRFAEFRNTFGQMLEKSIRSDVKLAGIRGYQDSRQAALEPQKIPPEVYDGLVEAARDNLDLLHRHAELKRKVLGVDELRPWDLYMPTTSREAPEIPFERAKEYVLEAVSPLGEEYRRVMEEGMDSRWIDVYENRGKRSGAYSGGSYDTEPFILMNYQRDLDSMFTLAHELGHSMHSYFTRKEQPWVYSDYSTFTAEVASTVNEALLTRYLLESIDDKGFRAHVLSHYLENFRTTFFRQTMFADFEQEVHSRLEKEGSLGPDYLDRRYMELKKEFYRPAELDDRIAREWMRIPHFYWSFYVYQYATGMSAAVALAEKIADGGASGYISFLKKGASEYPIELLDEAGVDMSTVDPIESALDVYGDHLERAEAMVQEELSGV